MNSKWLSGRCPHTLVMQYRSINFQPGKKQVKAEFVTKVTNDHPELNGTKFSSVNTELDEKSKMASKMAAIYTGQHKMMNNGLRNLCNTSFSTKLGPKNTFTQLFVRFKVIWWVKSKMAASSHLENGQFRVFELLRLETDM